MTRLALALVLLAGLSLVASLWLFVCWLARLDMNASRMPNGRMKRPGPLVVLIALGLAVAGCATAPPVRDGCDRDVPVRCHPPTAETGGTG